MKKHKIYKHELNIKSKLHPDIYHKVIIDLYCYERIPKPKEIRDLKCFEEMPCETQIKNLSEEIKHKNH